MCVCVFVFARVILQTCKLKQDTFMYTKVSMSMGGPFVALFCVTYVSQEWKDAHIFQFISMSGVYGGSSSPLNTLFSGACMHLCMHGCTFACMHVYMHVSRYACIHVPAYIPPHPPDAQGNGEI